MGDRNGQGGPRGRMRNKQEEADAVKRGSERAAMRLVAHLAERGMVWTASDKCMRFAPMYCRAGKGRTTCSEWPVWHGQGSSKKDTIYIRGKG